MSFIDLVLTEIRVGVSPGAVRFALEWESEEVLDDVGVISARAVVVVMLHYFVPETDDL